MTSGSFHWRPPLAPDWTDRLAAIEAGLGEGREAGYAAMKSLAN